jgi:hypothetical protein
LQQPLVSVFIDGLKPEWVEHMPFVRSIAPVRPLGTVLGYSIACHATMYTGLSPREHGLWFVWGRDEARSPFAPAVFGRVPRIADNVATRIAARKLVVSRLERQPRGYFGVPRIIKLPMTVWPGLWVSEERFWTDDGYTAAGPTIFELARAGGVAFATVGVHRGGGHLETVRSYRADGTADWLYLFFGEVDHAAHAGDGDHLVHTLRDVDRVIADRCREVESARGGFDLVLWSDHGHAPVSRTIDPYERLARLPLRRIRHVFDTNYARFWFRDDAEERLVRSALEASIPEGWALTPDELRRWEVDMPDNRYGDLVFYLDAPCAFAPTIWGFGRSQRSIHGYLPSNPDMDGALVSTIGAPEGACLADVFGMHAERLGLRAAADGVRR